MEILHLPRRAGKTTRAIIKAADEGLYIVCDTPAEATRVFQQAKEMGLNIPFPITTDDLLQRRFHGRGIRGLIIDNAEQLLQRIAYGVEVRMITLTGPASDKGPKISRM